MKRNLFRFGMAVAACALGVMIFASCNKDDSGKPIKEFDVSNEQEWNAAKSAIASGGNHREYIINIVADFSVAGSTDNTFGKPEGIKVSICGDHTISLNSPGSLIYAGIRQTVVIRAGIEGYSENNASLVRVLGGHLYLEEGGMISGGSGEGVYVFWGSFHMSGGKIYGNNIDSYPGGGVHISSGTFTMSGGEITGNSSSAGGGGVFVWDGTFTMSGGEITRNNSSSGGGVCVGDGTFTMSGGEITGNSSSDCGGGVSVWDGTFTMSGGEISGNSSYSGGGVHLYDSQFRKTGNSVIYGKNEGDKSNTAAYDTRGHAVYRDYGASQYRDVTAGAGVNITVTDGTAGEGFEN